MIKQMKRIKQISLLLGLTIFSVFNLFAIDDNCAIVITADDTHMYSTRSIQISKSCTTFNITLKHIGKGSKKVMGHNLVIAKTSDLEKVALEGSARTLEQDYLVPNDSRILAHTKMIGGGEETSVSFDVSAFDASQKYGYICTYPGHFILMRGAIELID